MKPNLAQIVAEEIMQAKDKREELDCSKAFCIFYSTYSSRYHMEDRDQFALSRLRDYLWFGD